MEKSRRKKRDASEYQGFASGQVKETVLNGIPAFPKLRMMPRKQMSFPLKTTTARVANPWLPDFQCASVLGIPESCSQVQR